MACIKKHDRRMHAQMHNPEANVPLIWGHKKKCHYPIPRPASRPISYYNPNEYNTQRSHALSRALPSTTSPLNQITSNEALPEELRNLFHRGLRRTKTILGNIKHYEINLILFGFCGLMSQSTILVMSRWSVNITTLFLGMLRPKLSAGPFASNLQLPYLDQW